MDTFNQISAALAATEGWLPQNQAKASRCYLNMFSFAFINKSSYLLCQKIGGSMLGINANRNQQDYLVIKKLEKQVEKQKYAGLVS